VTRLRCIGDLRGVNYIMRVSLVLLPLDIAHIWVLERVVCSAWRGPRRGRHDIVDEAAA
jgi:hypothetical protein